MSRTPLSSRALAAALIVSAAVCIASHARGVGAHPQDDGMSELSAHGRGRGSSSRRLLSAVSPKRNAMASAAAALVQPKACVGGACSAADCTLRPALTEGPYWWDHMMVRRNITEGLPGLPLTLRLTVVNTTASATSCVPIAGAMVDVWHASADGVYSHFVTGAASASDTTTYLRGIQPADSNGLVTFHTVYPGWYSGRCTHLHLKVHVGGVYNAAAATYTGGSVAFTSQLFFNDTASDAVAALAPYSARVNTVVRTRLSEDSIYAQGGVQMLSTLQFVDAAQGYAGGLVASLTLGVSTTGTGADASTGVGAADASTATSAAPRAVPQPALMSVTSALAVVAVGAAMYGAAAARI